MDVLLQQMVNGLSLGAIYALVAIGYTMVYGILRLINFAHGEVFMVGAMVSFYAADRWFKLPLEPADLDIWHWLLLGVGAVTAAALIRMLLARSPRLAYAGDGAASGPMRWVIFALAIVGFTALAELRIGRTFFADIAPVGSMIFSLLIAIVPALVASAIIKAILTRPGAFKAFLTMLVILGIAYSARNWFRPGDNSWLGFAALLLTSMAVSALLGFLIERLAYRPLRNQPRINALITAIGVSMFLQFAGQLIFFGADPKKPPETIVPTLLPGTREKPERLLPWNQRTVLLFGSKPAADDPLATSGVNLEGTGLVIFWTDLAAPSLSPSTTAPATRPLPTATPAGTRLQVSINAILLMILLLTVLLMFVLRYIVMRTRTGLALRAVSHRFDTAALMGVDINRTISFTFVLGSALAGAAGFLYAAAYPRVEPLMGLNFGLIAFVAAVVGGIGSIPGAVAGGFLLGIVQTLVTAFLKNGSQYNNAIAYIILIAVLLVRPAGLFGRNVSEKV